MQGPVIRDGAVLVEGDRIVAVGPAADVARLDGSAAEHDFGPAVILPGLVNAHAHLELSDLTPGDPPRDGADWLVGTIRAAPLPGPEGDRRAAEAVERGIDQCLRSGVTTVGDITTRPALVRPLLARSPLGGVSYGEVRAMAARRNFLEPRLAAAVDPAGTGEDLRAGVSPHAPYSIEIDGYRRCLDAARRHNRPLTTHLAEFPDEAIFLSDHCGSLRTIWDFLQAWDDQVPPFPGGPIRFAQAIGLLEYPHSLLAHVNYCDDAELDLLACGQSSIVYCPRTHAHFGHPPHRWREMLARGVNVAVGTDSCASSPDLNLVDDLRLLRRLAPDVPPLTLWEMATVRAARALGMEDLAGSLVPGRRADFVVFPVDGPDPLGNVLDHPVQPREVWAGGRRVR